MSDREYIIVTMVEIYSCTTFRIVRNTRTKMTTAVRYFAKKKKTRHRAFFEHLSNIAIMTFHQKKKEETIRLKSTHNGGRNNFHFRHPLVIRHNFNRQFSYARAYEYGLSCGDERAYTPCSL